MTSRPRKREQLVQVPREQRWHLLACELVRKETLRRDLEDRELARTVGRDEATISKLLNGKHVSEDTWFRVGKALGWGSWLDFVKTGSLGAVSRYGDIHPEMREYAIERLREIAEIEPIANGEFTNQA